MQTIAEQYFSASKIILLLYKKIVKNDSSLTSKKTHYKKFPVDFTAN